MTVYVKPMTWNGETRFYLGYNPSDPTARPSDRLGGYFLILRNLESAKRVAASCGDAVIVCPHFVGL